MFYHALYHKDKTYHLYWESVPRHILTFTTLKLMGLIVQGLTQTLNECSHMHSAIKIIPITFIR